MRRRPRASRRDRQLREDDDERVDRKSKPIWVSERPLSFFAYTGSDVEAEKPAKMKGRSAR